MSLGISGCGAAVLNLIVYGSTISMPVIAFVYAENGPGLFGTVGTRLIENATSSAVSSLPSWNLTPRRSLNSHVFSSSAFHDVATPGIIRESAIHLHQLVEDVLGDVVVRKQVEEVRVDRRDVGRDGDLQLLRERRGADDERSGDDGNGRQAAESGNATHEYLGQEIVRKACPADPSGSTPAI